VDVAEILEFNEFMHEFLKPAHRSVQEVQIEKREDRYNDPEAFIPEMIDDAPEITHGAKQPVEQQERLSLPLIDILEFTFLFDRIIHQLLVTYVSSPSAKIMV
jgi:hypothetical protein